MTRRLRARRDQIGRVVDAAGRWAAQEELICGLELLGSYTHGHPSMASDVDLVVLTTTPHQFTSTAGWFSALPDRARLIRTASWGRLTERRALLRSGLHLDIGFTDPTWADLPLDAVTRAVLADGHRVLYDPATHLQQTMSALDAVSDRKR